MAHITSGSKRRKRSINCPFQSQSIQDGRCSCRAPFLLPPHQGPGMCADSLYVCESESVNSISRGGCMVTSGKRQLRNTTRFVLPSSIGWPEIYNLIHTLTHTHIVTKTKQTESGRKATGSERIASDGSNWKWNQYQILRKLTAGKWFSLGHLPKEKWNPDCQVHLASRKLSFEWLRGRRKVLAERQGSKLNGKLISCNWELKCQFVRMAKDWWRAINFQHNPNFQPFLRNALIEQ